MHNVIINGADILRQEKTLCSHIVTQAELSSCGSIPMCLCHPLHLCTGVTKPTPVAYNTAIQKFNKA